MEFDLIIEGGAILDGSGNPWFRADVGIVDDHIGAIGHLDGAKAEYRIDAGGLMVAPGFIDMHSHSDFTLLVDPRAESKIRQGVTTEVVGNCGSSAAPQNEEVRSYREKFMRSRLGEDFQFDWETMAEYMAKLEAQGIALNVAPLVGHGTIRQNVMGFEDRAPTPGELEEMKRLTAEAMEAGAWGLSTGLIYPPGCYAKTEEIIELAKVAAQYGGIYASHIRGEGDTLLDAVREAIEIGEKAGLPVEISHFKASGKQNWGKTRESLRLVEEARRRGIDVTVDQYPYTASSTGLSAYLPHWIHIGGADAMLERLRNLEDRRRIKEEVGDRDWSIIMVVVSQRHPEYEGLRVTEIAEKMGKEPVEAVMDLLLEDEGQTWIVAFGMSEEDVQRVMRSPYMMVGSDGRAISPHGVLGKGKPHPRYYGTFPRILGRYVRELGVITLEEAVRKMTSAPARRLGLWDRGLIRPGFKADIVIFNPETVIDKATFMEPHQYPEGIEYVIVNGTVVIDEGEHTGALPGRVLRRS